MPAALALTTKGVDDLMLCSHGWNLASETLGRRVG